MTTDDDEDYYGDEQSELAYCFWEQLSLQQHQQKERTMDHMHGENTPSQANHIVAHTCMDKKTIYHKIIS